MNDDQMRMEAVIVDGFTGPLKKLREDLGSAGRGGTLAAAGMTKDWQGVRKELAGVTNTINTGLASALRGLSLRSLGISASIGGMFLGLRNVANEGRNLKFLSDQLGISVKSLREIEAIGQHFNIPTEQASASLKTFQDALNQIYHNYGGVVNQLQNSGKLGAFIAEDVRRALLHGGLKEAFDAAIKDLKKIPDPYYRRKMTELLFGTDQWIPVIKHLTPELRREIERELGRCRPAS